jgi:ATP adenylyltransferase
MEYLMSESPGGCIFCEKPGENDDRGNLILVRTPLSFIMLNAYPYNNGHLMIAPFRHVATLGELTRDERCDIMDTIARAEQILESALGPQGMNIGINLGHCAGAGIPGHVHVHIVPRWEGDTNFMPVVGESRVIPELLLETYDRLLGHVETDSA